MVGAKLLQSHTGARLAPLGAVTLGLSVVGDTVSVIR